MTLPELVRLFDTDEKCREILTKLRWPLGVECPRCKSKSNTYIQPRKVFQCGECDYQYSVLVGTVFNDSHLPLDKWFYAVLLLVESRKGISANQMKRLLGVSYKTAWYLCHRIRAAMVELNKPMLDGTVEIDETYVGGKRRGCGPGPANSGNKEIVIGIRQRGGDLRFIRAKDLKAATLYQMIHDNVSEEVEVLVTDEYRTYKHAMGSTFKDKHKTVNHKQGEYVRGDVYTNTVESAFSLLKRGIMGTWHKVSIKHLPAYLEEMTFRFNRRNNPDLFTDTLRHMITAPVLTFEKLTANPPTANKEAETAVPF
jgi:transposase-like protein